MGKGGAAVGKLRTYLCAAAFALICVLAIDYLGRFTDGESPLLGDIAWEHSEITGVDGAVRPVDINMSSQSDWGLEAGEQLRLTCTLPEEGEIPGLYEYAYLIMETGTGETAVLLDGEEYFRCEAQDMAQDLTFQQLHLTLPPDAAGKELAILFTPSGPENYITPAFARYSSEYAQNAFSAAYYNQSAIPTGAYSMGFVVLCAIFLVGLANGSPDWSLLLLAVATSLTAAREINVSSGYYFLSSAAHQFLLSDHAYLIPTALLLLYLFLNRRRSFWRYLGVETLGALALASAWYVYSRSVGGHFYSNVNAVLGYTLAGYPQDLLIWLNTYLLVSCGFMAAYGLLQNLVRTQSEARTLALKNDLIMDNYHTIEQNIQQTSTLRHELKNYVAVLDLLYQKGDMEGLGRRLGELKADTEKLSLPVYTDNYLINAILQNTAARAGEAGIRFQATAPLPPELPVDEVDLCSLLINLLDNALEAAGRVEPPDRRHISVRLKINQGFFAVYCENSYAGPPQLDEEGHLLTTKEDSGSHGFGIRQMESIAKKYGSVLNVSYTEDTFTVQTALHLK